MNLTVNQQQTTRTYTKNKNISEKNDGEKNDSIEEISKLKEFSITITD